MHHYTGMADPEAQKMIARLRAILKTANAVGIRGGLTALSNEAFSSSPEALRADWTAGHDGYFAPPGGHYHVEICPNKPGGMELILKYREEMLAAFADLDIAYVWNWPYDQGGCTCSRCTPWGANGFLKVAGPYAKLVRRMMPKAKIVLSTWYFDRFIAGEWEAFGRAIGARKPEFADYLLVDDYGDKFPEYPLKHGVPGGLPMLNFPEISMYEMFPWGGYGANPLPGHLQQLWSGAGERLSGGFPYSEGIFEDINKAVNLQHYWSGRAADETVHEYAGAVSSPKAADELVQAIRMMEEDHGHGIPSFGDSAKLRLALEPRNVNTPESVLFNTPNLKRAEECLALVERVEAAMTGTARQSWRWRLLRLRAGIDAELARSGGRLTPALDEMLEELSAIYHAEGAEDPVQPFTRRALQRRAAS